MPASEEIDLARLGERLAELGRPPLTFDPLIARLRVLLEAESKRCFHEARDPDGTPWRPLQRPRDRPRRGKKGKGGGDRPLRDTGALMQSVTARQTGPAEVTWGSGLQYAALQNYGGTVRKPERRREEPWVFRAPDGRTVFTRHIRAHAVTVPPRTFVGVSRETEETVRGMAAEFVLKELARRGLRR